MRIRPSRLFEVWRKPTEREFLARGGRNRPPPSDVGTQWSDRRGRCCRVSWLEATGELYAVDHRGRVRVLGTVQQRELVIALAASTSRPPGEWRVSWLRAAVQAAPGRPDHIEMYLAAVRRDRVEADARRERKRRESFMVVALDDLPAPEPPWRNGDYAEADWRSISLTAMDAFVGGLDPLDPSVILEWAGERLNERDALWVYSLFAEPVVVDEDLSGYNNGMHRTWYMIRAGVTHSVIEFA